MAITFRTESRRERARDHQTRPGPSQARLRARDRKDGLRVLVDRLWPRGVSKAEAGIDEWLKGLAPSTELRKWFGHDPARWDEFRRRYAKEIHGHADMLAHLRALAREGPVTLVYSAHDELHNDAVVLRDVLLGRGSHRTGAE